jgi:serine/threonine protein kinase
MIHDELSSQFGWSAPEVYSQKVKASLTADFWSVGALLLYIFYGVNL